jgi:hypothetical protein
MGPDLDCYGPWIRKLLDVGLLIELGHTCTYNIKCCICETGLNHGKLEGLVHDHCQLLALKQSLHHAKHSIIRRAVWNLTYDRNDCPTIAVRKGDGYRSCYLRGRVDCYKTF